MESAKPIGSHRPPALRSLSSIGRDVPTVQFTKRRTGALTEEELLQAHVNFLHLATGSGGVGYSCGSHAVIAAQCAQLAIASPGYLSPLCS